eukprot:4620595-Pleurochrysis_carterae.AAC.1
MAKPELLEIAQTEISRHVCTSSDSAHVCSRLIENRDAQLHPHLVDALLAEPQLRQDTEGWEWMASLDMQWSAGRAVIAYN